MRVVLMNRMAFNCGMNVSGFVQRVLWLLDWCATVFVIGRPISSEAEPNEAEVFHLKDCTENEIPCF